MNKEKKYLITGGSGFLGRALIQKLNDTGFNNLVVLARNEGGLSQLKTDFPAISIVPGDVADTFALLMACQGVSGIFHLAAMKHVTMAEENVRQCVYSNIIGTLNVLNASVGIDFVVGVSSDKAARVSGVYGATKYLQERLFVDYQKMNPRTKFRTARFGNIIYSTGSVLCKWKELIMSDREVLITEPDSTRFYWTVDQAAEFLLKQIDTNSAEPSSTPIKAVRLGDLLEVMYEKYGVGDKKIKVIGLQVGESKHENLSDDLPDSLLADRYTKEELTQII